AGQYKAWGEVKEERSDWAKQHGLSNPIRFQGQYHDHETGLHYNRYRYYNPQCGRFINQDPAGYTGGLNLFGYVKNPTQWIDPTGLTSKKVLEAANRARANGQETGAASVLTTKSGKQYVGVSGSSVEPQNPEMTAVLMAAPAEHRAEWHGNCSERVVTEMALNDKEDIEGAVMETVAVGNSEPGHGLTKKPCRSCRFMMEHFKVKVK
ncbi:RHS repeat-associated core domain-containing protein, partial [Pseudomonas anuradhapurensis]